MAPPSPASFLLPSRKGCPPHPTHEDKTTPKQKQPQTLPGNHSKEIMQKLSSPGWAPLRSRFHSRLCLYPCPLLRNALPLDLPG